MKVIERVIVAEHSELIRKTVGRIYRPKGVAVAEASTLAQAREYLDSDRFQLLMIGDSLSDTEVVPFIEERSGAADSPYIAGLITQGNDRISEQFLTAGAQECLSLPFAEAEIHELFLRVRKFLRTIPTGAPGGGQLQRPLPPTTVPPTAASQAPRILGRSPPITALKYLIGRVAPTDATVFIHGESGTGKELVAKAIHQLSARASAQFVKLNCAALPESLVESELFGHERGSFTGALSRREGRFAMAHGGTLLLDEVSEVSLAVQSKLLRVLQEREFERVGGNETLHVDVRLIATTNRNLEESVERGEFRQDLFYRLNVVPIHMPPLRERTLDVLILAEWFLEEFCRKHRRPILGYTPEVIEWMRTYRWPGNIRELQNLVERAVIINEDTPIDIDLVHACQQTSTTLGFITRAKSKLPSTESAVFGEMPMNAAKKAPTTGRKAGPVLGNSAPPSDLPLFPEPTSTANTAQPTCPQQASEEPSPSYQVKTLATVEREHILQTLQYTKNNRNQAARLLNINIRTLRNKLSEAQPEESGS